MIHEVVNPEKYRGSKSTESDAIEYYLDSTHSSLISAYHLIQLAIAFLSAVIPSLPGFTSLIKGFRRGEMTVLTGPTG